MLNKSDLVNKLIESTVKIKGGYFIPYKKAMDLIADLDSRPIIINAATDKKLENSPCL